MTTTTPSVKSLLSEDGLIIATGAYDAITARLIERAGLPLVYVSGGSVAAARGFPDYGLLSMPELADAAAAIARSVSVPCVADADTGFGNELNITRTVEELESRGILGIQLEDQVSPKRCGHLAGKDVIPRQDFAKKIAAAVAAKRSADFVVIARTDAIAVNGFDDAVDRANAALDAGADIAFVEAPETRKQVEAIPDQVHGPCLLNLVPSGKTPLADFTEIEEIGYRVALCAGVLLMNSIASGTEILAELQRSGKHPDTWSAGVPALMRVLGADKWDEISRRYA
jgi:2-methylisocitrate lyase-like PEP mutase family enzyme